MKYLSKGSAEEFDEDIHVIPEGDLIPHKCSTTCECLPYWDEQNKQDIKMGIANQRVYVHRKLSEESH